MKFKRFLLVLVFMMTIAPCVFADDPGAPCTENSDPSDPFDNSCSLDSWLYILVLAPVTVTLASVFAKTDQAEHENKAEDK